MRKFLVGLAAVFSLLFMARPVRGQIQGSWVNTGNLNTASEGAVLVTLVSGKALLAGGSNGSSVLAHLVKCVPPIAREGAHLARPAALFDRLGPL